MADTAGHRLHVVVDQAGWPGSVDLIGELELLSLQLPVGTSDDQDRNDVAAFRADITKLITAITIGLSDAD